VNFIELLLKRLEAEQAALARSALQRPQGRDAFEYGRVSGMYGGFAKALEIILAMVDDKDRRDHDL
jgi:hypothetical protein